MPSWSQCVSEALLPVKDYPLQLHYHQAQIQVGRGNGKRIERKRINLKKIVFASYLLSFSCFKTIPFSLDSTSSGFHFH